jgi:hypothetical protein
MAATEPEHEAFSAGGNSGISARVTATGEMLGEMLGATDRFTPASDILTARDGLAMGWDILGRFQGRRRIRGERGGINPGGN